MLVVDLQDVFDLEEAWDRELRVLSDGIRRGVDRAVKEGANEALNTRRYQDQTGLLTSRIRGYIEISVPGGAVGMLAAFTDYASFVNDGTGPHPITGNPWLMFKGRDGQWVRTHQVNHPGTRGDGFMSRAYFKAERVIIREVELSLVELVRRLGSA